MSATTKVTHEFLAAELVRLEYVTTARVGIKFGIGLVIYIGNARYLEYFEALKIVRKLSK